MRKVVGIVIALLIIYGGLELAHKNGIRATLQMECEKLNIFKQLTGFKSIESLNVPWFSPIKRLNDGVYPCTAKLTMTKADGTDETVNVQFDAKRVRHIVDVVKTVAAPEAVDDWAINWYPWGDEYTVSNLKRAD